MVEFGHSAQLHVVHQLKQKDKHTLLLGEPLDLWQFSLTAEA